jgi:transcriptional regulator with XRE-family HTH domain
MLISNIKDIIKKKLEEQHKTVSLAEKLAGLQKNAIRNILNGNSLNPSIETCAAIAKVLGCSLDELIGNHLYVEPANNNSEIDQECRLALFKEITNMLTDYVEKKRYDIKLFKVQQLVKESYLFALNKKGGKADQGFIEWLIDNELNK